MEWDRKKGESLKGSVFPAKDGSFIAQFRAFDYTGTLRTYRKTKFKSLGDAWKGMRELEQRALDRKKPPAETPKKQMVGDYIRKWHAQRAETGKIRASTAANENRYVKMIASMPIGSQDLSKVTVHDVEDFLEELADDKLRGKLRAQQQAYAVLRMALKQAPRRILPKSPCVDVRDESKPRAPRAETKSFTIDEQRRILEAVEQPRRGDTFIDVSFAALVWTLSRTGARIGEVQALRWQDIDFAAGVIRIEGSIAEVKGHGLLRGKTKSGRHRAIPMKQPLADRLQALKTSIGAVPHGRRLVFTGSSGNPFSRSNLIKRRWHPLLDELEIDRCGFHRCRHTFASLMLAAGADVVTVAKMLGHKNPAITLGIYSHAIPGREDDAADRLEALLAEPTADGARNTENTSVGRNVKS